jgi:hypothetical protein
MAPAIHQIVAGRQMPLVLRQANVPAIYRPELLRRVRRSPLSPSSRKGSSPCLPWESCGVDLSRHSSAEIRQVQATIRAPR